VSDLANIDTDIDALYQLAPHEFTAARTALAKTLAGDQARQVRALKKPTAVPWAVNQLYWKGRPLYDAAMKAGHALRAAQIATLKGKKADVRAAMEAHRKAIASAVHGAVQLASAGGVNPNTDQLARMLEALSLAATPSSDAGRFTDLVSPSGFDALTGVTPVTRVHGSARSESESEHRAEAPKIDRAAEKRRLEQEQRERREADARLKTATRDLERARERADEAREALRRAEADVANAERDVAEARERRKAN